MTISRKIFEELKHYRVSIPDFDYHPSLHFISIECVMCFDNKDSEKSSVFQLFQGRDPQYEGDDQEIQARVQPAPCVCHHVQADRPQVVCPAVEYAQHVPDYVRGQVLVKCDSGGFFLAS